MRAILIDPYKRTVRERDFSEPEFGSIKSIIGGPTEDKADCCRMWCHTALGGGVHGYLDDEGNWTQEEWFRLGEIKVLYCGRMLLLGEDSEGEVAALPAEFTTTVAATKVRWLDNDQALRFAAECDARAVEFGKENPDVIYTDDGLAGRIAEVVERKRDRLAEVEGGA